eukprot:superscaffoldBa00001272_g9848
MDSGPEGPDGHRWVAHGVAGRLAAHSRGLLLSVTQRRASAGIFHWSGSAFIKGCATGREEYLAAGNLLLSPLTVKELIVLGRRDTVCLRCKHEGSV